MILFTVKEVRYKSPPLYIFENLVVDQVHILSYTVVTNPVANPSQVG